MPGSIIKSYKAILQNPPQDITREYIDKTIGGINEIDNNSGLTILIYASQMGKKDHVRKLISLGCDLDIQINTKSIKNGNNALIWAIANSQIDTSIELIKAGSDLDKVSNMFSSAENRSGGHSALTLACAKGSSHCDDMSKSANPKPMSHAIEALIEHGANVNYQDFSGKSPLHYSALHRDTFLVKKLLEFGANPELLDKDGKKPIDMLNISHKEVQDIMIKEAAAATIIPEDEWKKAKIIISTFLKNHKIKRKDCAQKKSSASDIDAHKMSR